MGHSESATKYIKVVEDLKNTIDAYLKLFLEHYPLLVQEDTPFCPYELHKLAIKAQCQLSMLGQKAKNRLSYIGFNELFPFDNPVDWYNWKKMIKEKNIDHTIYASISIRVDSEIERIILFLSYNNWDTYNNLSDNEYLVSKKRYEKLFSQKDNDTKKNTEEKQITTREHIRIDNINVSLNTEKEAVDNLDKLHKKTSTISNIVDIVANTTKLIQLH